MAGLMQALGLKIPAGGAAPRAGSSGAMPPPPHDGAAVVPPEAAAAAPPGVAAKAAPPEAAPALNAQLAEFDAAVAAAKLDVDALTIAPLKATLAKELEALTAARAQIGKLAATAAMVVIVPALAKAKALRTRAAELKAGAAEILLHQENWAVKPLATLSTLVAGKPAEVKTTMEPQLGRLRKLVADLRGQIEKGDFKAADRMAEAVFFGCAGTTRAVNEFATDYPAYKIERDKAEKAITQLKAHAQAKAIDAEIRDLASRLVEADGVASKADLKGWQKSTVAVKQIPVLSKRVKTLADELAKVAAKAPALTKKFKDAGADDAKAEKMAGYAMKMLVEEKCTDAEAMQMAKDADGFVAAGLEETDALISSRVKRSLVSGGTSEAVAQEIGKNLRAGGTSTADDAKAVAAGMKNFPKKVLEDLNKAGIQTECCRGPVTEVMPELSGVLPRGWPAGSTWDSVPGVYSGSSKKVVVGTMDKGGKRHVPARGEGPIPHGTPDLIGHEGGHAFDAAEGTLKSKDAKFLAARDEDVKTGNPDGMWGPRDNYFLTTTEGGTNDAGATSETFAESFAMHFGTGSRWPKLEAFWAGHPWGT